MLACSHDHVASCLCQTSWGKGCTLRRCRFCTAEGLGNHLFLGLLLCVHLRFCICTCPEQGLILQRNRPLGTETVRRGGGQWATSWPKTHDKSTSGQPIQVWSTRWLVNTSQTGDSCIPLTFVYGCLLRNDAAHEDPCSLYAAVRRGVPV